MFDSFLEEIKSELIKGHNERYHPFKLITLATIDANQKPEQRIVVLRNSNPDLKLTFFTDLRSQKVIQIKNNGEVSAHFYHPEKKLQLVFRAKAYLEQNEQLIRNLWGKLTASNKRDYTTQKPPGSFIKEPQNVEYLNHQNNFCVVHLKPTSIEYLKLNQPQHLRILFEKNESGWQGQFLVP